MIYGSVCSGIEAATQAWHPLGWTPAWFSEIEPFACAALAHHYPDVPNLGDMTKIHERQEFQDAAIDVLVGGTPCQSFSVAGLRRGLADPRGNLALVFLDIARRLQPQFVIFENVPGLLSIDDGEAFRAFLDMLEDCGYVVEADILDACHFGLAQRRRRIFVVGHHFEHGRRKKSRLFATTTAQVLLESLLCILAAHGKPYSACGKGLESPAIRSVDGLRRRMRLLGLPYERPKKDPTRIDALKNLQSDLIDALEQFRIGSDDSICRNLETQSAANKPIVDIQYLEHEMESAFSLISPQWSVFWDAAFSLANMCITSTETSSITETTIFTCAAITLNISVYICSSMDLSANLWTEDSSGLIALKEFMNYARSANKPLLGGLDGYHDWGDFIQSAEICIRELEQHLGDWRRAAQVLFEPSSLRGDPAPRRKAREGSTPPPCAQP